MPMVKSRRSGGSAEAEQRLARRLRRLAADSERFGAKDEYGAVLRNLTARME
jgi:hypothetical protein